MVKYMLRCHYGEQIPKTKQKNKGPYNRVVGAYNREDFSFRILIGFYIWWAYNQGLHILLHEIHATNILTRRKLTPSEINANDQLCLLRVS